MANQEDAGGKMDSKKKLEKGKTSPIQGYQPPKGPLINQRPGELAEMKRGVVLTSGEVIEDKNKQLETRKALIQRQSIQIIQYYWRMDLLGLLLIFFAFIALLGAWILLNSHQTITSKLREECERRDWSPCGSDGKEWRMSCDEKNEKEWRICVCPSVKCDQLILDGYSKELSFNRISLNDQGPRELLIQPSDRSSAHIYIFKV